MEQNKIDKRIKELQNDPKFTFKLTEDVIDTVYRTAVKDCALENYTDDVQEQIAKEINDSIADKLIFSVKDSKDKKIKELIEELEDLKKKLDEERAKPKRLPKNDPELEIKSTDNQFQSGLVTGLKYAMMSMEGHNIEEAWKLVLDKYNSVMRPTNNLTRASSSYNAYT